ncbi:MAG: type II secretion system protein [Oscillospiraceae bacterium]|nr:type II secretion system protein [Oscillospiraceae bacterium]
MKGPFKNKQGSTLLEIIVAIAILGLMVAPVCASLVLSFRLNAESEKILQARLLVESTVEQLMAEGLVYEGTKDDAGNISYSLANKFPENVKVNPDSNDYFDIYISITQDSEPDESSWYKVTVWSGECTDVSVTTNIRIASASTVPAQEGGA